MPGRSSRANPLALAVLVTLYEQPAHPYQVAQTLRARAKHDSVRLNYGSLYGVVEGLEKKGLIKATVTVQEGRRPQRTVYEITDRGASEMTDWLTETVSTPVKEYPVFMAGLSFLAALDPDDALTALRSRSERLSIQIAAQRATMELAHKAGLPKLFELEAAFEHHQTVAELTFVNQLVTELASGELEGLDLWRQLLNGEISPEEVTFDFDVPES